jgi:hypothetical protein
MLRAGDVTSIVGLSYVTFSLTGEAGEIANKVKKILRESEASPPVDQRKNPNPKRGFGLFLCRETSQTCPRGDLNPHAH